MKQKWFLIDSLKHRYCDPVIWHESKIDGEYSSSFELFLGVLNWALLKICISVYIWKIQAKIFGKWRAFCIHFQWNNYYSFVCICFLSLLLFSLFDVCLNEAANAWIIRTVYKIRTMQSFTNWKWNKSISNYGRYNYSWSETEHKRKQSQDNNNIKNIMTTNSNGHFCACDADATNSDIGLNSFHALYFPFHCFHPSLLLLWPHKHFIELYSYFHDIYVCLLMYNGVYMTISKRSWQNLSRKYL